MPVDGMAGPSTGTLPHPTEPPRTGARSSSLDTRQKVHIGPRTAERDASPPGDPAAELWRILEQASERVALKFDYADVLGEIARRAELRSDFERWTWFDAKAGAIRDCANVRVVPHRGTDHGVATPISCHVRGEPDCERARVARLLARHDAAVQEAARPVMLTLTHRNAIRGELAAARRRQARDFGRFRRRAIFRGGKCRERWPERDRAGALDGAPMHPCHEPKPRADCRSPRCAPGCERRAGARRSEHLAACDAGCPTRTGLRRSRCPVHRPVELHVDGCPLSCQHRGHRKDRNCATFAHDPVAGGISSFDVTFNEASLTPWNLHLHMLLDAPWMSWAELRNVWQAVTCDRRGCRHGWDERCAGAWSVWIARVDGDDEEARHAAIREVLKYVGKPHGIVDSLDPERVEEYLWATRHQRIAQGFGRWYGVALEEDEPADADHHLIRIGFMAYRVPIVCPVCRATTTEDDWGWPMVRGRLEANRLERGYGWRHPPPASA